MRFLSLLKKKKSWLVIAILIAFARMSFGYFSEAIQVYIAQQTHEYCEKIVYKAMTEEVLATMGDEPLFHQEYDSNGKISYAYLNTQRVNEIRNNANRSLINSIAMIDHHDDFDTVDIPLGYFFSRNYFLANGIRIPINLEVLGSHSIDFVSEVIEYGINNSVIEISLEIKLNIQIFIPFQENIIESTSKIPLSLEIISNDVPNVYVGRT